LDLRNGNTTSSSQTHWETNDTLLRQRSVEHSVSAVLFVQTYGASEHTAKLDILSKDISAKEWCSTE
jgi:hypothetical protein